MLEAETSLCISIFGRKPGRAGALNVCVADSCGPLHELDRMGRLVFICQRSLRQTTWVAVLAVLVLRPSCVPKVDVNRVAYVKNYIHMRKKKY